MSRIPEMEIERLKREIPVERLARDAGVSLKQHGEELLGLCPFHDDKQPSLVINPSKNLWHCLGACQAGGSVIDWVMREKGLEFRDAVLWLQRYQGVGNDMSKSPRQMDVPPLRKGDDSVAESADSPFDKGGQGDFEKNQPLLKQVINHYHHTLKQNAEAMAYLEKRGIASPEAIDKFQIGFCDRTYCLTLPDPHLADGKRIRDAFRETGLLRKSGHEHFRGSIVIPVMNADGDVTEVYGRKIGNRLRAGTPLHLYLPGPHRGVWNEEGLMTSSEVILCESLIDALTFWCAGYRNVTCAYGIEGFTADHLEAFRLYGIERILIAYDRDDAGEKAAALLAERLIKEEDMECFRIQFPKGMDANGYVVEVESAEKSLGQVIRNAEWMGGKVSHSRGGGNPDSASEMPDSSGMTTGDKESHSREGGNPDSVLLDPRLRGDDGVCGDDDRTGEAEIKQGEVTMHFGDRRWRIRGLEKCLSFDAMRVNILVAFKDTFHVDTFDLYSARHRQGFVKTAAAELSLKEDILKKDFGKMLLKLEELQEKQIHAALNPKKDAGVTVSEEERTAALELLKSSQLLERILEDFEKCGVVGEETNKLTGYLAAVSRKLEKPLAIVIQSSSAAGKSALMESILSFFPGEEQVKYSAMTGQSLFYMGETNLKHKILAIAEEEGAERASYALKLLQSEGELTIASTGKDPSTGRLETQEYHVEGPVMIFLTTTAIEIDEELLNRCIVLSVDEDRSQTRAIHALQRESQTLEGLLMNREKEHIIKLHQNAQRLLRSLLVANPFAKSLTFLDNRTRTRRDHMKYLTLIRSIALLHQYQREVKTVNRNGQIIQYIEVTPDDIAIANRLSHQVLGRSLDELSPQTRRLLILLDEMVSSMSREHDVERCDVRFSRRQVREFTGLGCTQTRIHLDRLVALEYVVAHHGNRGQSFEYELVFDGDPRESATQFMGLIDVKTLKSESTTTTWRGEDGTWRGHDGPKTVGWRDADRQVLLNDYKDLSKVNGKSLKITHLDEKTGSSCRSVVVAEMPTVLMKGGE